MGRRGSKFAIVYILSLDPLSFFYGLYNYCNEYREQKNVSKD
jgi:hypothetical protein